MVVLINKPRWNNKEWSLSLFPYIYINYENIKFSDCY